MFHNYQNNIYERFRRSILTGKHLKSKKEIIKNTRHADSSKKRLKKNANSSEPDGVFVKEEKFVIKYGPIRRNYPKYNPHDEKQHEAKLNHPFYKISQRFDEMLNKYNAPKEVSQLKHIGDTTTENLLYYPQNEMGYE